MAAFPSMEGFSTNCSRFVISHSCSNATSIPSQVIRNILSCFVQRDKPQALRPITRAQRTFPLFASLVARGPLLILGRNSGCVSAIHVAVVLMLLKHNTQWLWQGGQSLLLASFDTSSHIQTQPLWNNRY